MTGLLVSVRNVAEAEIALAAGVDLIDVKEPGRGSLGAATPEVWRRVVDLCGDRRPVSAALGELLSEDAHELAACAHGLTYAKVGLAGCARDPKWVSRWKRCLEALPDGVSPVAVAYADAEPAFAPRPEQVLGSAAELGCRALLIDTYDKARGDLFAYLNPGQLRALLATARKQDLFVVLAGSLGRDAIPFVEQLGADYIAVRGAVCQGARDGVVDTTLVKQFVRVLTQNRFGSRRQAPTMN